MAGISEEMRRKMRVDRQKGHVQAGNASWKGTAQGRGGGECMTHDMRDIWVFGWRLSSLTQEGSFLTADISFEIAAVVYAQKNAARKHIFFFLQSRSHVFSAAIPLFVNLTAYYSQQMSLPRYDIEDPSDGDAGQGAVVSPQPWVNVFVRSCQSESCITRQTGVKHSRWNSLSNGTNVRFESTNTAYTALSEKTCQGSFTMIQWRFLSLSISLSHVSSADIMHISVQMKSPFFTRQDASSRAQHGMITDSRWGKQQGQKDETSCPRTVASVHLANTNWHWQEELPVGKKTKQNIHLLAFEIIMNAIY